MKKLKIDDNFKKLYDPNQHDIFKRIEKLQKMIDTNNLEYFGIEIRKTIEELFGNTKSMNKTGSLDIKLAHLTKKYKPPINVKYGLDGIRHLANRESHAAFNARHDKLYGLSMTISECNVSMRNLWLFIKWILVELKTRNDIKDLKYIEKKVLIKVKWYKRNRT